MPSPSRRVRSKKRVKTKSSGGKTVIHYGSKKVGAPCCSSCGQTLAGLPHQGSFNVSKLSRTQKRVGRMHSGNLCPSCLRNLLRNAARNL